MTDWSTMKAINRLVYYALGGGLGHLTRTRAIIEALLQRLPLDISLITNCRHYSLVFNNHKLTIAYVANQTELSIQLTKILASPFDLLIVDTFPRGLMGELTTYLKNVSVPRILIQRYLNEHYLTKFQVADFVEAHYSLALRLYDNLPRQALSSQTIDLSAPIVLEPTTANLPRLLLFSNETTKPRLLMVDFGATAEQYWQAIPPTFAAKFVTVTQDRLNASVDRLVYYPVGELLAQADIIVGASGYNLFYEVQTQGLPAIFLPQPQTYDDQYQRAQGSLTAFNVRQFNEILTTQQYVNLNKPPKLAANGATLAAELILSHLYDY